MTTLKKWDVQPHECISRPNYTGPRIRDGENHPMGVNEAFNAQQTSSHDTPFKNTRCGYTVIIVTGVRCLTIGILPHLTFSNIKGAQSLVRSQRLVLERLYREGQ